MDSSIYRFHLYDTYGYCAGTKTRSKKIYFPQYLLNETETKWLNGQTNQRTMYNKRKLVEMCSAEVKVINKTLNFIINCDHFKNKTAFHLHE